MQVFIYEYFTGGGAAVIPQDEVSASLWSEAVAMAKAVTEDFAALGSVRVVTTRDNRWPPFHAAGCDVMEIGDGQTDGDVIGQLSRESEWTLLIAPEMGGSLLRRVRQVEASGGRLLSPSSWFVKTAGDKQATAETLDRSGVPVPRGCACLSSDSKAWSSFPAVVKPLDGCGSQNVRLVQSGDDLAEARSGRWRIEKYVSGIAASVSVLCGLDRNWPLAACEQRLSDDGKFFYLGGRLPIAPELDHRARQLALRAIEALPQTTGYVGVDLVLGEADDGSGDYVIEVNPRLTTSYVGLRALSRSNLAAAMLSVAAGEEPVLSFGREPVEFTAAGEIL